MKKRGTLLVKYNKRFREVCDKMGTLFEKITANKETLAEYLLKACDNPLCECDEDMCDFCELSDISNDCTEERCLNAIVKALDSQVN